MQDFRKGPSGCGRPIEPRSISLYRTSPKKAFVILSAALFVTMQVAPQFMARAQTVTAQDLARRTIERRAVEAVIWGMPAVNLDLMLQAMLKLGGKPNQVVYWSRLPDWKN